MIYLDNNATTAVDEQVLKAMLPSLQTQYGNPSSTHRFGQEARQAVEQARYQVAQLLNCSTRELAFTSGGTESDNAALSGLLAAHPEKRTIITSAVEHSAIRLPLEYLSKPGMGGTGGSGGGYRIIQIPVDGLGRLDMDALATALADPDVAFATMMWANNETGVIFDVVEIARLARQHGVPLHVDAVQAAGKIPIVLSGIHAGIDLLSISGHKIHGPKGVGALFVRRGVAWTPLIKGGPQERDRRGGTENVPGIVGLGKAAELACEMLADPAQIARLSQLRDKLERAIIARVPESQVIGDPAHRVDNTTNIGFSGLEAEAILLLFSEHELFASAGAACSSGSLEPSPVLKAMERGIHGKDGLPERLAHGAIRFSLSRMTTEAEIERALEIIPPVITRLRQVLPL